MRESTPTSSTYRSRNRGAGEIDDADGIRIEPLTAARILQVFPLIREAVPQVRLEEWTRFARSVDDIIAGTTAAAPDAAAETDRGDVQ